MNIIAIDCGASFIKASRFVNGEIVTQITTKTPSDDNPHKLEESVIILKDIINKLTVEGETTCIGFSNEMHGFVLTDEEGIPVIPYMSWQNERAYNVQGGVNYLDMLRKIVDEKSITVSGMPLKAGLPSVNLFCVLKEELKQENNVYYFYTLGDYYIRALSGKQPFMHETNAAGTGLYNIQDHDWNQKLINTICEESNCKIIFPSIYNNQEAIKQDNLIYYPALGDQQAALLGAGFSENKDLSLNFGTGAQISILSDTPDFSSSYQVRPFFNNKYIKTIPHIPSGRALNVYFNFVKEIITEFVDVADDKIWEYINRSAEDNNNVLMDVDMSFFTNAVTSNVKGSILNIDERGLTLGNLFDSVYERMAENIYEVCRRLKVKEVERIIISGGVLSKNVYLQKKVLERFDKNAQVIIAENETAKGIAEFVGEMIYEN